MLDNIKPVWQRSRNITQMLRVIPETVVEASVKISKANGLTYKYQVTGVKTKGPGEVRQLLLQSQSDDELRSADAT